MSAQHGDARIALTPGSLPCIAGCFVGLVLLLAQPACAQSCTDAVGAYVQYKVSYADLAKCGFTEYTNLDLPRIHIYHQQDTHATYSDNWYPAGINYTTNWVSIDCGANNDQHFWEYPGAWHNYTTAILSISLTEWMLDTFCNYSNDCTGSWGLQTEDADTRAKSGTGCGGDPICVLSTFESQDFTRSAQLIEYNGGLTWCWVGSNQRQRIDAYDGCKVSYSNSWTETFVSLVELPGFAGALEASNWTLTHLEYVLAPGTYDPVTTHGGYTADLTNEYTDDELRTNIMKLMPSYADGWYTPGGSSYDFFGTIAYSLIDGDHANGGYWWWPYTPELQKMQYRIAIPDSQAGATYSVSWDVITYDTTTGKVDINPQSCQVAGTGDPAEPVYSTNYEVMPPYWDDSREVWGGLVLTWVDHVSVSVSRNGAVPGSLPGGPGPLPLGGVAVASAACAGGACGGRTSGSDGFAAEFSMGQGTMGNSAGSLITSAARPSLDLASPAALLYVSNSPSVEVISLANQMRQVNAPQALADIVTNSAFAYEVRYYLPEQVGSIVNGLHQVSGSPFVTWRIENPDASTNTYNRLRISETRGGDVRIYNYLYTASTGTWKLDYPGGALEHECALSLATNTATIDLGSRFSQGIPGYTRSVTARTRVSGGPDQFQVRRDYQRFAWGESLVQETVGAGASAETTTYVYSPEGRVNRLGHPLQKIIRPDGSWRWFTYDGAGRYDKVYSSLGDIAPDGGNPPALARRTEYSYGSAWVASSGDDGSLHPDIPRCTREFQNGSEVSARYTAFPSLGLRIDVQTVAPRSISGTIPAASSPRTATTPAALTRTASSRLSCRTAPCRPSTTPLTPPEVTAQT